MPSESQLWSGGQALFSVFAGVKLLLMAFLLLIAGWDLLLNMQRRMKERDRAMEPKKKDSIGCLIGMLLYSALLVTGSVTIPTSVGGPEQRVLSGQITGSLLYPSPQQGYNFTDKIAQISIPVQLHLVPQATLLWSWNQFSWQLSFFVALVGSVALIGIILRGVLQAYRGQKKRPGITDQVWAWGGGLVLASIVMLILWAVFDTLARAGIAGSLPGDISFRDLFLPCMVGASGMIPLVSLVY